MGGVSFDQALFAAAYALPREVGMEEALSVVGLPLTGTHHRGVDDAYKHHPDTVGASAGVAGGVRRRLSRAYGALMPARELA